MTTEPMRCGWTAEPGGTAWDPDTIVGPTSCDEPATHTSCDYGGGVCAKHVCRCSRPLNAAPTGCGDASCVVAKPTGQHTNGGCRCDERALRRAVQSLRARLAEVERERDMAMGAARSQREQRHADLNDAAQRISELEAHVKALTTERDESRRLLALAHDPQRFVLENRPPDGWHAEWQGVLLPAYAEILVEVFKETGTPNYFETEARLRTKDGEHGFTITVQRWDGKTPHQKRVEAEKALSDERTAHEATKAELADEKRQHEMTANSLSRFETALACAVCSLPQNDEVTRYARDLLRDEIPRKALDGKAGG